MKHFRDLFLRIGVFILVKEIDLSLWIPGTADHADDPVRHIVLLRQLQIVAPIELLPDVPVPDGPEDRGVPVSAFIEPQPAAQTVRRAAVLL